MKTEGLPTVGATDLEARIDENIRQSNLREYYPTEFERMRAAYRTIGAVERLVTTNPNDPQSGFNRLHRLDILEWSLEVAVRKFPHLFTKKARNCAEFRLTSLDRQDRPGARPTKGRHPRATIRHNVRLAF